MKTKCMNNCGCEIIQPDNYRKRFCTQCQLDKRRARGREYSKMRRMNYEYVLKHRIYDSMYYRGKKPESGFFASL